MAKFRKRPVVISAEQYLPNKTPFPAGVERNSAGDPIVRTLEGDMAVSPGDYIITGVKGERYPCKEEIFLATYEPVE